MTIDPDRINAGLFALQCSDTEHVVFGANGHRYLLRARLTESQVAEFEQRYDIRLPEDYRQFLLELGNGGAGPFYGILGLDQLEEIGGREYGDPSRPFPLTRRWRGDPQLLAEIEAADIDDEHFSLVDRYWDEMKHDGAIVISDYGCALRLLLVVNGQEEYGNVWFDQSADLAGFSPVALNPQAANNDEQWCRLGEDTSERVSFGDWYHCWLDWACRCVNAKV